MKLFEKFENKGVTLIALIITIIILIILVGVSFHMILGPDGLIKQTKQSKEQTDEANKNEKISLSNLDSSINEYTTNVIIEKVTDKNPGTLEGNGTEINPYVINSIEDLIFFSYDVTNGNTYEGKNITLGLSLDFNSTNSYVDAFRTDYHTFGYLGQLKEYLNTQGFFTIGRTSLDNDGLHSFKGSFNGNYHSIINFYQNITLEKNQDCIGLFATNFGNISNLYLENFYIKGNIPNNSLYIGGICGRNRAGSIKNCSVSGKIYSEGEGTSLIGGITGFNRYGNISGCSNQVDILNQSTGGRIGGIAGVQTGGEIINCYNHSNIILYPNGNATKLIGGIVGELYENGIIRNCYSAGDITNETQQYTAGICAYNYQGIIENVFNMSKVKGNGEVGGIIGFSRTGSINNIYNSGEILGESPHLGLLVGKTQITITNGYYKKNQNINAIGFINGNLEIQISELNELPNIYSILGEIFTDDIHNRNHGYPILNWQS